MASRFVRNIATVAMMLGVTGACSAAGGCADRAPSGALASPEGAVAFDHAHREAFDDGYTAHSVPLVGRAPHDVLDQRLFAQRLGFSDLLAVVRVEEVFGKGRLQARKQQYLAVDIQDVLVGTLPRGTRGDQLLAVHGGDPLAPDVRGRQLLLFVKWAPGEIPSFHYHLSPADEPTLAVIAAMVKHAQRRGYLGADGSIRGRGGARGARGLRREREQPKAQPVAPSSSPISMHAVPETGGSRLTCRSGPSTNRVRSGV